MDVIGLAPYEERDLELTVALETDPEVMKELGGPSTREQLLPVHARRLQAEARGGLWLVITLSSGGLAEPRRIGQIGVFRSGAVADAVDEVGWSVLPAFQGRGIASRALAVLIERLRERGSPDAVYAFPGVTNAPSNALCEKLGFELLGQITVTHRGNVLRCNRWRLRL